MTIHRQKYCLDANVLIQGWQKYYAPRFCPDYWNVLNDLGKENRIFIPEWVFEEIVRTEDELSRWLKQSNIPVYKVDEDVILCLRRVYDADPSHVLLVDNTKQRSIADPWVIAHAINEGACVVTKEEKVTASTKRVKIPNVCDNMNVRWINDFQLIEELNIHFNCVIK
jgi:hypothetical protein